MPYEPIDIGNPTGPRPPDDGTRMIDPGFLLPQYRIGNEMVQINPFDTRFAGVHQGSEAYRLWEALRSMLYSNNPSQWALQMAAMSPANMFAGGAMMDSENAQFQQLLRSVMQYYWPGAFGAITDLPQYLPPRGGPVESPVAEPVGPDDPAPIIEDPFASQPPPPIGEILDIPRGEQGPDDVVEDDPPPSVAPPSTPQPSLDGWLLGSVRYDAINRPWVVDYGADGNLRWRRAHLANNPDNQARDWPPDGWREDQTNPPPDAEQTFVWSVPELAPWVGNLQPPKPPEQPRTPVGPPTMPPTFRFPREFPDIAGEPPGAPRMASLFGTPENYETSGLTPAPTMRMSAPQVPSGSSSLAGGGAAPNMGNRPSLSSGYTAPRMPTAPTMPRRQVKLPAPMMRAPRMY